MLSACRKHGSATVKLTDFGAHHDQASVPDVVRKERVDGLGRNANRQGRFATLRRGRVGVSLQCGSSCRYDVVEEGEKAIAEQIERIQLLIVCSRAGVVDGRWA